MGINLKNKEAIANIYMFLNGRNDAIKFVNDSGSVIIEAKRKATKEKGLKISTPKQMLQRLQIELAQVKAGNTAENVLNEIRQIIYSLYQTKGIAKKSI